MIAYPFVVLQLSFGGVRFVVEVPEIDDVAVELDGVAVGARQVPGFGDRGLQRCEIGNRFTDLGVHSTDGGSALDQVVVNGIERLTCCVRGAAFPSVETTDL